jgi:hypothetical protein
MDTWVFSPEDKEAMPEVDPSPLSNSEFKNEWSYNSIAST